MNKIPKVIHYCWFGGNPLSESVKKCIESWKKFCPDYKIIEWNEKNFDVNSNIFVKEAFESKKWAFITDYVRLYVLDKYGGIYMDTDVEVIKNIDCFLQHNSFSGFEQENTIPTAIMGAEKNNKWIKYLLSYYDNRHFLKEDGSMDITTNVVIITNMTKEKYRINLNNSYQELEDGVVFYPKDYFCPKDYETGRVNLTNNTYVIHHFSGSWKEESEKKLHDIQVELINKYGEKIGNCLFKVYSKFIISKKVIKNEGIFTFIKKVTRVFTKKD